MDHELRNARVRELLAMNGYLLLLLLLSLVFVYVQVDMNALLVVLALLVIAYNGLRLMTINKPMSVFKWKRFLLTHEQIMFGPDEWKRRRKFDAIVQIAMALVIGFLSQTQFAGSSWTLDEDTRIFLIGMTAVLALLINYSTISKGRTIDTWTGGGHRGIELHGRTLHMIIGIGVAWLVVLTSLTGMMFFL
ncbi:hypothetical protein [Shouchella patagoniensis]|uniref:hypothetical protein n=1 Tax=Shouchella patagoniensis TaxID=228576 RepID=UPI0011171BEA|nr:hypothetical protein [Shouchella patagoniensis]